MPLNAGGEEIVIATPVKDAATSVLKDPNAPDEQRELATKVLKYFVQQIDLNPDRSDSNSNPEMREIGRLAWLLVIEMSLEGVWWSGKDKLVTKTERGVERL